jgi:hypothetical protein
VKLGSVSERQKVVTGLRTGRDKATFSCSYATDSRRRAHVPSPAAFTDERHAANKTPSAPARELTTPGCGRTDGHAPWGVRARAPQGAAPSRTHLQVETFRISSTRSVQAVSSHPFRSEAADPASSYRPGSVLAGQFDLCATQRAYPSVRSRKLRPVGLAQHDQLKDETGYASET